MFGHFRQLGGGAAAVASLIAGLLLLLANSEPSSAHDGHDHGEAPKAAKVVASPRVAAVSERYQFVGIVEGEVLVVYLDRADDNSPVTTAAIDVSLDGETHKAELQKDEGTYEVTSPLLRKPGQHEVLVTIAEGDVSDLLVGTLTIPAASTQDRDGHTGGLPGAFEALKAMIDGRKALALSGMGLLAAAVGGAVLGRRKLLIVSAAVLGIVLATAMAWAHDGHDHGADLSAASGNSPSRRPDGTLFVPKPTQRLLEIRTRVVVPERKTRAVRFHGRIVANPTRSGIVQSTSQGRYAPPKDGVPPLGTTVKAGDLLGHVTPSFAFIDSSDMMQTLGTIDQEIALARRKLARQEQLLASNAVAKAAVEDIRIQIEGLEKRRKELLAARVRPEELRAPVSGVIAAVRVMVGQVVGPSDQLFQIIDPASLMVEALVFDPSGPDAVHEATASITGEARPIALKFLGRSRALEKQYSLLQFEIVQSKVPLNVGAPVTVVATAGDPVTGILLPRSALAQAPSGQTVVFSHKEPEVFVPRPVRAEPFDTDNVLIAAGIQPGERIVVKGAPLINQVR